MATEVYPAMCLPLFQMWTAPDPSMVRSHEEEEECVSPMHRLVDIAAKDVKCEGEAGKPLWRIH